MKVFELRFKNILIFLFLIFSTPLFSQENDSQIKSINLSNGTEEIKLSNQNISWSKVIPGKFICQPQKTSFGFVSITDAKTITAITNEGKLYYENTIPRFSKPKISVLKNDFLVISDSDNSIYLINPSGSIIWTKKTDSKIVAPAFSGRDGRFFVLTQKSLICYGINGICKWKINHNTNFKSDSENQIYEFSDGTLGVVGNNLVNRYSPFGILLETKTFAENISGATQIQNGIIVTTSNKSILLEIAEDKLFEKWITQFNNSNIKIYTNQNKQKIIALSTQKDSAKIFSLDSTSGQIKKEFLISNIKNFSEINITYTTDKIFINTNTKGSFFTEDGTIIWTGTFPKEKQSAQFNYCFLSNDNHLIFCKKNWTIDAYRLFQDFSKSNKNLGTQKNYKNFYKTNPSYDLLYLYTLDSLLTDSETEKKLKEGNYAQDEIEIISRLIQTSDTYIKSLNTSNFGTRTEKSVFEKNAKDFNQIILITNLFGTDTFVPFTSSILTKEKDPSILLAALSGIKENGYDPEGKLINSLELLAKKTNAKNKKIIYEICDGVYSICKFMGNQVFFEKGKDILTKFIYPNYPKEIRDYARDTMGKISNL